MSNSSLQGLFQRKTVFWKSFIFCREPLQTQSDSRNLEKAVPQLAWPHASKCHLCNIDSALDDAKEPWFEQRSLPFSYLFTKKGGHSQVLRIVMQFLTECWREADRLRELSWDSIRINYLAALILTCTHLGAQVYSHACELRWRPSSPHKPVGLVKLPGQKSPKKIYLKGG